MNFESNEQSGLDFTDVGNTPCEISYTSMIAEGISSSNVEIDEAVDMELESFCGSMDPVCTTDISIEEPNSPLPNYEDKYSLKKLKYPDCAAAVIKAIADLARLDNIRGEEKSKIQAALTDEYIFGKIDELSIKGIPRVHSEFQLMNILTQFICNSRRTLAVRNAIILSIFPCTNPRYGYLGNLICFSICVPHTEILDAAGIWIQQVGSTSDCSQMLAMHIVDYFCKIAPSSMADLVGIAKEAPYFNANMLTAIAEVFKDKDPSDQMLHLVDAWININPNVLIESLTYHAVLPPGGIPMTPITPIAGLLRWCIMCPTRQESYYYDKTNLIVTKRFMLYYAIFNKLLTAIHILSDSQSNKNAVSAYDLEETMHALRQCLQSKSPYISKSSHDLAMGRLSEFFRIATAANCIYGNMQKLWTLRKCLEDLHSNNIDL